MDVRIALVVAQHHVESRAVLLDQVVLEHQRFDFGARDRDLDARDRAHHRVGLAVVRAATLKIARDAAAQVARLAHVDHVAARVEHAVDAGLVRQVTDDGIGIEADGDREIGVLAILRVVGLFGLVRVSCLDLALEALGLEHVVGPGLVDHGLVEPSRRTVDRGLFRFRAHRFIRLWIIRPPARARSPRRL